MSTISYRPAWVDIDLDIIKSNASILASTFAPSMLCAAVKANGYGHGVVEVGKAALEGGASGLAVALVEEGLQLREGGIDAPILLLYQVEPAAVSEVVRARLTPVLYSLDALQAYSDAVMEQGLHAQPVHLMLDTGMHREGASPVEFLELCRRAEVDRNVMIEGVSTHFAVADDPADPFTQVQARRFTEALRLAFPNARPPVVHCANSAAGISQPHLRMDMVRCGIALYGQQPSPSIRLPDGILPAMSVRAHIGLVRDLPGGETVGYGRTFRLEQPSRVAVIPVGYGDGVPRGLSNVGSVLIGGKRRPIVGTISMDQLTVDCGDDRSVEVGDEVVFMGRQGDEEITGLEIAELLGDISYEITTRMGARFPRRYIQGGAAVDLRQQHVATDAEVFV